MLVYSEVSFSFNWGPWQLLVFFFFKGPAILCLVLFGHRQRWKGGEEEESSLECQGALFLLEWGGGAGGRLKWDWADGDRSPLNKAHEV